MGYRSERKGANMSQYPGTWQSVGEGSRRYSLRESSSGDDLLRPVLARMASHWWLELVVGVAWVVIAVVVLKFNHASLVTVGVLTGLMFLWFAAEMFIL